MAADPLSLGTAGAPARLAPRPRSPRQRILMTGDTVGGVWRYALELSRELIARGHEVALASMGGLPSRAQRAEADAVPGLQLHASAYRLLWQDDPWRDVQRAGEWLLRLAADVQPTLVHLNDLGHGDLAWPAPVLLVAHSCVASWWRAVHRSEAPPEWQPYRRQVAHSLAAADLVVAPSRAMLGALQCAHGNVRAARVIPNGRRGAFDERRTKGAWVLSAGRVEDAAKNMATLAHIAPSLSWPVCIAGADALPNTVARDNVYLLGRLGEPELQTWLARAAIYCLPARYEPFGLSVLEAAHAGCALVLGDIESLRENWDGAALFVAPDDARGLSRTLERVIGDSDLRERMGLLARSRAQRFQPGPMAEAYLSAYAEIGAAQPARRAAHCGDRR